MIIKLSGKTSVDNVEGLIKRIVLSVEEQLGTEKSDIHVVDLSCGVVMNIDGEDRIINIEHNDKVEVLTVMAQLDDSGNITEYVDAELIEENKLE